MNINRWVIQDARPVELHGPEFPGDLRLYETREAAISGECNRLMAEAEQCRRRLVEINRDFWQLKGQLK